MRKTGISKIGTSQNTRYADILRKNRGERRIIWDLLTEIGLACIINHMLDF